MNNKFIRVISPFTLVIVLLLDLGVIFYGIFAVKHLAMKINAVNIIFSLCIVFAVFIAFVTTRETVRHGVVFRESELEFTGIDDDNIFRYDEIKSISCIKDVKASLVKNFVDRQSRIVFKLNDERVVTVNIGLTTKNKLSEIEKEINSRI